MPPATTPSISTQGQTLPPLDFFAVRRRAVDFRLLTIGLLLTEPHYRPKEFPKGWRAAGASLFALCAKIPNSLFFQGRCAGTIKTAVEKPLTHLIEQAFAFEEIKQRFLQQGLIVLTNA